MFYSAIGRLFFFGNLSVLFAVIISLYMFIFLFYLKEINLKLS